MDMIAEVVSGIAEIHGYASIEALAEDVAKRGCYTKEEVMAVFTGEASPCVVFVPMLSDLLGLSGRVERRLHELVLLEGEREYLALAHGKRVNAMA